MATRASRTRTRGASVPCCPRPRSLTARATRAYAPLFKALADETRLEIVGLLAAAKGELCVCDIEERFDLGQPTISHHLRLLREAGVVQSERRGTWVYYTLRAGVADELAAFRGLLGS